MKKILYITTLLLLAAFTTANDRMKWEFYVDGVMVSQGYDEHVTRLTFPKDKLNKNTKCHLKFPKDFTAQDSMQVVIKDDANHNNELAKIDFITTDKKLDIPVYKYSNNGATNLHISYTNGDENKLLLIVIFK